MSVCHTGNDSQSIKHLVKYVQTESWGDYLDFGNRVLTGGTANANSDFNKDKLIYSFVSSATVV